MEIDADSAVLSLLRAVLAATKVARLYDTKNEYFGTFIDFHTDIMNAAKKHYPELTLEATKEFEQVLLPLLPMRYNSH